MHHTVYQDDTDLRNGIINKSFRVNSLHPKEMKCPRP